MRITLSREAKLFGSRVFMIKVFLSLLTAFYLFHNNSLIGKDMISLLFGIMLALEPVSVSGIRSGFSQIKASIIGGLVSAIIILIGGINYITVPLAVALTIYVTLVIDWKNLSIIAIFTAIYMTQYIQFNVLNEPSVLLTFKLRMAAVFTGVFIAIIFNTIFSKLFFKSLVKKRTIYLFEKLSSNIDDFINANFDADLGNNIKIEISNLFNDIDMVGKNVEDLKHEKRNSKFLMKFEDINTELRNSNHYFMDIVINNQSVNREKLENLKSIYRKIIGFLENDKDLKIENFKENNNKNISKMEISSNIIIKLLRGDKYE